MLKNQAVEIVDMGTHEELLSRPAKYADMWVGYHVFTLESLYGANANCRNFAPLYDIPEEAATGTSNGALGCYLYSYLNTVGGQKTDI